MLINPLPRFQPFEVRIENLDAYGNAATGSSDSTDSGSSGASSGNNNSTDSGSEFSVQLDSNAGSKWNVQLNPQVMCLDEFQRHSSATINFVGDVFQDDREPIWKENNMTAPTTIPSPTEKEARKKHHIEDFHTGPAEKGVQPGHYVHHQHLERPEEVDGVCFHSEAVKPDVIDFGNGSSTYSFPQGTENRVPQALGISLVDSFNDFALDWCPPLVGEGVIVRSMSQYRSFGSVVELDCAVGFRKVYDVGTSKAFENRPYTLYCGSQIDGLRGQWQDVGSKKYKPIIRCRKIVNW
jgi:hypothetical protein